MGVCVFVSGSVACVLRESCHGLGRFPSFPFRFPERPFAGCPACVCDYLCACVCGRGSLKERARIVMLLSFGEIRKLGPRPIHPKSFFLGVTFSAECDI